MKTVGDYSTDGKGGKIKIVVLKSAFVKAATLSASRIAERLECFGDPDGDGYAQTLSCAVRTARLSADIAIQASGGGIDVGNEKKAYIDGYVYEAAFKIVSESMYKVRQRASVRSSDVFCPEGLAC